jgi:hypothetical protein
MKAYRTIPTLAQWRSDSSVTLGTRSSDVILSRIDALVAAFNERPREFQVIVCDLYFTIDYWLKYFKTNSKMEKGREPAMMVLFKVVVDYLCGMLNCRMWSLRHELETVFGRELTPLGLKMDLLEKRAQYLERAELEKYKIWFRGGMAYQWPIQPGQGARQLVNSADVYNARAGAMNTSELPAVNYGSFVLSMERDFYMARHAPGSEDKFDGFYHSSYMAGKTVMAAGSMLIVGGRIERLRPNSGHYKPLDTNTLAVVQTLLMVGAPIHDLIVEDFLGKNPHKARDFLQAGGDWGKLKQGRVKNLSDQVRGQKRRHNILNPPKVELSPPKVETVQASSAPQLRDRGYADSDAESDAESD